MNRNILERFLTLKGFDVLSATNGAAALELAGNTPPDLILMDMAMPVLDGWETVRRIRTSAAIQHLPIIALTAFARYDERERCLAAGCNDYIAKPVNFAQLLSKVQQFLPAASEI